MKTLIIIFTLWAFVLISIADAQVPKKISYQGLLTTSAGTPVLDGKYNLQFDIYNLPVGGSLNYTETQTSIPVSKGTFSVVLRPTSNIFAESLFVEVTALAGPSISSPVTFSPRSDITTVPYAFRADTAQYAFSAQGLVCAGTNSGTFGVDIQAVNPKISVTIICDAFHHLAADQVVATASAYVVTSGSPPYQPVAVAARPYVLSGTLRVELWFDQIECTTYDTKTVWFAYTLSQKNN